MKLEEELQELKKKCFRCWAERIGSFGPQYELNEQIKKQELEREGNPPHTFNGNCGKKPEQVFMKNDAGHVCGGQVSLAEKLGIAVEALQLCAMPYEPDIEFTAPDTVRDLEERQQAARQALDKIMGLKAE